MKKRKIESIILIGIIVVIIIICIIIGLSNNLLEKRTQVKIDNLISAKSIDIYMINNGFTYKKKEHYIDNVNGNSIKNILNIISSSKATARTSFESYRTGNLDNSYQVRNSYFLKIKDEKNNIIGSYHIYNDNHLMFDDFVVTLSDQKYNELTAELSNMVSKDTGVLNCKNADEEDNYYIVNSEIKDFRKRIYISKDNYEEEKIVEDYRNKYEGFNIALITSQNDVSSGTYHYDVDENTMILLKTYDFDTLSEEDTRKLLNISKEEFVSRTFDDIKKEYPLGACEYQLW